MTSDLHTRLEQLLDERRAARHRAIAYAVAIAPVLVANLLGLLGWKAAIVADAAAIAAAAWWFGIERRAAHRRRIMLDDLIIHGWTNVAPDDVRERTSELLSPRHRRILARGLENIVEIRPGPGFIYQRLGVMHELRRQSPRFRGIAQRLRSDEVDVRGVVLVEQLLTDGGSPLHAGPSSAIAPALERVERALDRAA
jgi:hypothetical protein